MPSLPSQQTAALAHSLARQPASSSDLAVDGKYSPPAQSKKARRGAKHQRRKSMGAPASVGVRKAATFAGGTAPPGEESEGFQFMNFTMDHKEDIIKGVAPSGSGKTKQRRDREAAERTRRLSEAIDAGIRGDFTQLQEVHRLLS